MSPSLCTIGRWVEDHEVVHNIMYNATTNSKVLYKQALKRSEWWDNGALPLWITAQNQVRDSVGSQQTNTKSTSVLFELKQQGFSLENMRSRSPAAPPCGRKRQWSPRPSGLGIDCELIGSCPQWDVPTRGI